MDVAPRVSIGLPVYNGQQYLRQALDSLLAQTFHTFEVIISDNASNDATPEICRDYAACDPRIRYVRHDVNRGAAWNFNYVFGLARGVYFKWHAHDDMLEPTFLEQCVTILDHDRRWRLPSAAPASSMLMATRCTPMMSGCAPTRRLRACASTI